MTVQLPNNCIGVQLPDDAKNPTVIESHSYFPSPRLEHSIGGVDLPPGSYTLLFCTNDKVTEEQAREVVERFNNEVTQYHGKYYDYSQKNRTHTVADKLFDTSVESYHSLIHSKNMTGNWAILKQVNK